MAVHPLDQKARIKTAIGVGKASQTIHLRTYPSRTSNNATGAVTLGTATHTEWYSTAKLQFEDDMVDGDVVRRNDCKIVVPFQKSDGSTLAVVPTPETVQVVFDKGTAAEEVWDIVHVKALTAVHDPCGWLAQLRRV